MQQALIVGASSAIARALMAQLIDLGYAVVAISSKTLNPADALYGELTWIVSDYSEASIESLCSDFRRDKRLFNRVFIFNGLLHCSDVSPEKSLQQVEINNLLKLMQINAFLPLLWLKHLKPVLKGKQDCLVTILSARIGSISDNRKGGWYAYRASKAALNMLVKTAALEYQRDAGNVRFLLFHPGTTDTPLSQPFQSSIHKDKLFSPQDSARCLLDVVRRLQPAGGIQFMDWQNTEIPW